jgi:hypothetical protein
MKKKVKVVLQEIAEYAYYCDRCGCAIDDPQLFGRRHNVIELDSYLNYPECGGCGTEYELCEECFNYLENLLIKEIKHYNATITE